MKILDRIGLTIFSVLILIISVLMSLLIFGWLSPERVYEVILLILNDPFSTNTLLTLSIICIILSIKCIFFSSDKKEINGIKDGILLQNEEGSLVISKLTLEELINSIVKGFESVKNVTSKIVVDEEKKILVYVLLDVKENAIIKELSNNLQSKIKTAIKNTSDLEVKEVNISIKELHPKESEQIQQ